MKFFRAVIFTHSNRKSFKCCGVISESAKRFSGLQNLIFRENDDFVFLFEGDGLGFRRVDANAVGARRIV